MNKILFTMALMAICQTTTAQGPRRGFLREAFTTETPMAHDPVMAKNGAAMLIQRPISWTADGWPELK